MHNNEPIYFGQNRPPTESGHVPGGRQVPRLILPRSSSIVTRKKSYNIGNSNGKPWKENDLRYATLDAVQFVVVVMIYFPMFCPPPTIFHFSCFLTSNLSLYLNNLVFLPCLSSFFPFPVSVSFISVNEAEISLWLLVSQSIRIHKYPYAGRQIKLTITYTLVHPYRLHLYFHRQVH